MYFFAPVKGCAGKRIVVRRCFMVLVAVCLLSFATTGGGQPLIIDGKGRTIHVLCIPLPPPFVVDESDQPPSGFFVELIRALAELEGMRISLRFGNQEDLKLSFRRGPIDVVLGTPHPLPRDFDPFSYLQVHNVAPGDLVEAVPLSLALQGISGKDMGKVCFSLPVLEEPYVCVVPKGGSIHSLRDLRGKPLAVKEGDAGLSYLGMGGLSSSLVFTSSVVEALKLVSSGGVPGALLGSYQSLYARRRLRLQELEPLSPPLFSLGWGVVVPRGDVGLAVRLGRGLETLRQNGTYRRLSSRWFGAVQSPIVGEDTVVKVSLIFLAILGVSMSWPLLLQRQVDRITGEREKLLDFVRDGIVAVDKEGRITMINRVAQDLLAVDASVVGEKADRVIPDADLAGVLESGEPVFDVEQTLRGSLVMGNKAPILFRGEVSGAIATFRDMTEIHLLAQEITGVRMYVESLRVQNHEFQNKLQAIAGLIQMGRYEKALQFITEETMPERSTASFVSENIKNPAVGGIVIGKVGRCRELGIQIRIDPDSYCGETDAVGDQALVVIIGNLLENGMEAVLSSGVPEPRIDFGVFDESNQIMISVTDNAGSLSPDVERRMFYKGFSTKVKERPSGFGLYNVKKLVEAMNGALSVEYEPGEYTEFLVTLPNGGTDV